MYPDPCPDCLGTGEIDDEYCPCCDGTGLVYIIVDTTVYMSTEPVLKRGFLQIKNDRRKRR